MKDHGLTKLDGGYLDTLMKVPFKLLCKEYPSEIRWHGVKILLVVIGYISIQYVMLTLMFIAYKIFLL